MRLLAIAAVFVGKSDGKGDEMDSISLKMPVTIKAKLTEKLKAKIIGDLEEGINRAELEVQQLALFVFEHEYLALFDGRAKIRSAAFADLVSH